MPEDKTTLILTTLQRLETKADTGEARHLALIEEIGSVKAKIVGIEAQIAAMEKADDREANRQAEDRGGSRTWIGMVFATLLSLASLVMTLIHRK